MLSWECKRYARSEFKKVARTGGSGARQPAGTFDLSGLSLTEKGEFCRHLVLIAPCLILCDFYTTISSSAFYLPLVLQLADEQKRL